MKTSKYTIKGRRGITDLQSIYAFHFNDQGGGDSNEAGLSLNSNGWWSFNDRFKNKGIDPRDQRAIDIESIAIAKENEEYINQLHLQNRYGEEYETTIEIVYNPLFDDPNISIPKLESYRMEFLDFSKNDDNGTIKKD